MTENRTSPKELISESMSNRKFLKAITTTESMSNSSFLQAISTSEIVSNNSFLQAITTSEIVSNKSFLQAMTASESMSNNSFLQATTASESMSNNSFLQAMTASESMSNNSFLQALTTSESMFNSSFLQAMSTAWKVRNTTFENTINMTNHLTNVTNANANEVSSTQVPVENGMPLLWFGESYFDIIHYLGVFSCSSSVLVSVCTILFLFIDEKRKKNRGFYSWTIGERLVIYLALFDLAYSGSHTMDHVYIIVTLTQPPGPLCAFFGVLLAQFILGQGLVVMFTAVSACCLVIWQKKINLGRWDWRLLLYSLGIPGLYCCFGVIYGYIGFSGAWCLLAIGTHLGRIMNNVKGWFLMLVFSSCTICYGAIWLKMRTSGPSAESEVDLERKRKYYRSAKVMLLFVLAYLIQWVTLIIFDVWALWETPSLELTTAIVFLCNWGGVFNATAYTIMRRKYLNNESMKQSPSCTLAISTRTTQIAPVNRT